MTLFRNLLMVAGMLAIVGVALFLWRGPELFDSLRAKPAAPAPVIPTGKAFATLSANQGALVADTTVTEPATLKLQDVIEVGGNGFPPKNIPYLAVVNKQKNEVRYWKLSKNVRKVSLRPSPNIYDVKMNEVGAAGGSLYQVEVWISRDGDLNLQFDSGPAAIPQS